MTGYLNLIIESFFIIKFSLRKLIMFMCTVQKCALCYCSFDDRELSPISWWSDLLISALVQHDSPGFKGTSHFL